MPDRSLDGCLGVCAEPVGDEVGGGNENKGPHPEIGAGVVLQRVMVSCGDDIEDSDSEHGNGE